MLLFLSFKLGFLVYFSFKHNITSKASDESKYLQAGYSSQLIFHLRRHVVGARKHKLITALSDEGSIPSKEDLAKGIMALSRQWKCLLGDTDVEFISRPAGLLKRPVVGRGVLTERDRAILMNTENRKSQDFESMGVGRLINNFIREGLTSVQSSTIKHYSS